MTVAYNDRVIPLALHSSNPSLTTNLNLGYDFTEVDASHTDGVPWISPVTATLTKAGTLPLVTRYGEVGRQMTNFNTWYTKSSATNFGIWTGTGDFTIAVRIGTPTTAPTNSSAVGHIVYTSGDSGIGLSLLANNISGTGIYLNLNYKGTTLIGSGGSGFYLLPNKRYVLVIKRVSNVIYLVQYDVETGTIKQQGNAAFTDTLDTAYFKNLYLAWTTTNGAGDLVLYGMNHYTSALTDTVIQNNLGPDWYSTWVNNAIASTIGISSPTTGATVGQTATISGVSEGTIPSGVQVQFNGGSWVSLTGFTYSSGTWSGTASGLSAGTGNLLARKSNETATVSSAVSNITVQSDNIAVTNIPAYRVFQRNLANNQAIITLSGTYTGTPTAIEYRLGTGIWSTLASATISGGTWSGTATLSMSGGPLQVRFANNTAITGQVVGVSVGDIWICGGQSNMTNPGNTANAYVPSNGLTASKFTHDFALNNPSGSWAELTDPYDAQGSGQGSVIALLATYYLAAGIPVAFVPCAIGSTAISVWQKGGNGYYDNMLARYNAIGGAARGLLFWQGEGDAAIGTSQSTYESLLNSMVNSWYADTGLKTVVFRIHEGGPGTQAQHDAIREAQTLVGTNNPYAVLGPDPYGIETTDVHFTTPAKQQQVADRAWPCIASEFYGMPKAVVSLVSTGGVAQANKRNIKYAFFDQVLPSNFTAPTAKGGFIGLGGVTGNDGTIKIPLQNTTLTAGQTGFLVLTDTDGTVNPCKSFAAPVSVS